MAIEDGQQILPTEGFEDFAETTPEEEAEYENKINDPQELNDETAAVFKADEHDDVTDKSLDPANAEQELEPNSQNVVDDTTTDANAENTSSDDANADDDVKDESGKDDTAKDEPSPLTKKEEFERYSRSVQRRINKEVKRRAMIEEENRMLQERLARIENKLQEEEKQSETAILENRLRNATAYKQQLLEDAEYEKVAQVDNDIMQMMLRKKELEDAQRAQQSNQPNLGQPPVPPMPQGYPQGQVPQPQQPYDPYQPVVPQQPVEQSTPEIQTKWIQSNERFGRDPAYTKYVNDTYDSMLEEGYDPESPSMYEELNRRTGTVLPGFSAKPQQTQTQTQTRQPAPRKPTKQRPRSAPPPNANQAQRVSSRSNTLTEADKINMRNWGLDPNDKAVRQEWLQNKAGRK